MSTNPRLAAAMFLGCCLAVMANSVPRLYAAAQTTQQADDVVFDVASIRLNTTQSDLARRRVSPGGGYSATRISLVDLILTAYGIERFRLVGGPPWMRSERFDIVARATGELTTRGERPTLPGALRALLKDRFQLVAHQEIREFPVYVLKVAREGRLGPNISPRYYDCATIPILERQPGQCSMSGPGEDGRYFAGSAPISSLVGSLRPAVDRPIIDETGLTGNFKIDLTWTPARLPSSLAGVAQLPADGASIFTAIQEQLGLRLDATMAPLPVLVIDAIEYPTND